MGWFFGMIVGLFKLALFVLFIVTVVKVFAISRDVEEIKRIFLTGRR